MGKNSTYPTALRRALHWPHMKSLHPVSENPPPERTIVFWNHVRFFIETIWALFGGPETIASLHNLTRRDHTLLSAWLRKAEALVRALLVIEAASLSAAETKVRKHKAVKRDGKTCQFNADEPHLWRVSFKLSDNMRTGSIQPRVGRFDHADARFPNAWPLAERFEALLRVFDAPELYVKRATRLIRRNPRIRALTCMPMFEGFEEIFEPLRPLLREAIPQPKLADTS